MPIASNDAELANILAGPVMEGLQINVINK